MTHYYIFAGEPSGDLHGSRLMQALKNQDATSIFSGVGGPLMRSEKLKTLLDMENFRVMGFTDVLKAFPQLFKQFFIVRNAILKEDPDCVILIDYPGFNLRLAKSLRKKGYKGKIVQYICPTVWAHGKKRIDTMTDTLDLLLTIFPFEAAFFAHSPLKVRYVGNPLVENIHNHIYQENWTKELKIPTTDNLIAIFPGSRPGEIQRHAPLQLETANLLKKEHPNALFAISYADEELLPLISDMIEKSSLKLNQDIFLVPAKLRYELMRDCKASLAKSGTVNLELALHHKPTVVVYSLSKLNYYFAKYFLRLRLPFYCIVNIIFQKEIFPEFIGERLEVKAIYKKMKEILSIPDYRTQIIDDCQSLQHRLGRMPTHQTAAKAIEELLSC